MISRYYLLNSNVIVFWSQNTLERLLVLALKNATGLLALLSRLSEPKKVYIHHRLKLYAGSIDVMERYDLNTRIAKTNRNVDYVILELWQISL